MSDELVTHKKVYDFTNIAIANEDRWTLKRIAASRGMKLYSLVHELTQAAATPAPAPTPTHGLNITRADFKVLCELAERDKTTVDNLLHLLITQAQAVNDEEKEIAH